MTSILIVMYKSGLQLLRKGIKTEMVQWKQNEKWKVSEKGVGVGD